MYTKGLLTEEEILTAWLAFTLESISTFFQKNRVFNEWMKYGENNVNDDICIVTLMIPKSIYICSS